MKFRALNLGKNFRATVPTMGNIFSKANKLCLENKTEYLHVIKQEFFYSQSFFWIVT